MEFVHPSQMPTGRNIFSEKPSKRFCFLSSILGKSYSNIKIPEQDFLFETRAGLTETKYRGSASANE